MPSDRSHPISRPTAHSPADGSAPPQTLDRTFKPSWVFAMALGAAIGWGAFILPFDWMLSGGLAGTLIGFAIGASMIAVIAVSYGFVIRALPVTGGAVAYALASLGKNHAFIAAWAMTLGYTSIVALNASAVTLVFRVLIPDVVQTIPLYDVAGWTVYLPEVLIASAFIIVFGLLNSFGSELSGRFQFYAVVILIASVLIISVYMIGYWIVKRPQLAAGFPPDQTPFAAIFTIVAFAPWAYVGFDSIPQLAGEFNFSAKKALGLLLWGVAVATLIYMAMMVSTSIAVGTNHAAFENDAWPPATAIKDVMGPVGLILMVISVSMGVLTGLNGFFAAASRVLVTMGRAGLGPAALATVHGKKGTPTTAIAIVAAMSLLSPWLGRAALNWVVDMSSAGITIAYFYACFCTWRIARGHHLDGMAKPQAARPVLQVISIAGCLLSIAFMGLLLIPGSPGALEKQPLIALVIWVALGVIFYLTRRKALRSISREQMEEAVYH